MMTINFNFNPVKAMILLSKLCLSFSLCAQDYQIDTFELVTTALVDLKYNASSIQFQQKNYGFQLEGRLEDTWYKNLNNSIPINLKAEHGIVENGVHLIADGAEAKAYIQISKSEVNSKEYVLKIKDLFVKGSNGQSYAFIHAGAVIKAQKNDEYIKFNAIPSKKYTIFTEYQKDTSSLSQHGNICLIFQEQWEQHQVIEGKIINFQVANDVIDKDGKIIIAKGAPASGKINNFEICEDYRPLRVFIEPDWVQTLQGRKDLNKSLYEFRGMPNQAYIPKGSRITVELN